MGGALGYPFPSRSSTACTQAARLGYDSRCARAISRSSTPRVDDAKGEFNLVRLFDGAFGPPGLLETLTGASV